MKETYNKPTDWRPPVTDEYLPQEEPFCNFGAPDKPFFGAYGKEPNKVWEKPNGDICNPGGQTYDKSGFREWSDKENIKDEQTYNKEESAKDKTQNQDKTREANSNYETPLLHQGDSSPELTLINAELEKARIELAVIKDTTREQISTKINEAKEKINLVSNDKNIEAKEKNMKINKLKKELSAKIKEIKEDATDHVKDVIDKQNLNIESILSYS